MLILVFEKTINSSQLLSSYPKYLLIEFSDESYSPPFDTVRIRIWTTYPEHPTKLLIRTRYKLLRNSMFHRSENTLNCPKYQYFKTTLMTFFNFTTRIKLIFVNSIKISAQDTFPNRHYVPIVRKFFKINNKFSCNVNLSNKKKV